MAYRSNDVSSSHVLAIVERQTLAKLDCPNLCPIRRFEGFRKIGIDVPLRVHLCKKTSDRQTDGKHIVVEMSGRVEGICRRAPADSDTKTPALLWSGHCLREHAVGHR